MECKFLSAFFFLLIIGMTYTFPAKEQSDVEIIPVDKKHRMHDIYDTFDYDDSWYPRIPAIAFPDISSIFKSVQDSLESVFKAANGTRINFPDLDSNKTKTTSVTKKINGHKVEFNETVYKDEDEHGGAVFRVSIINVLPDSEEAGQDSTVKKDVEGVDESTANEIASNGEGSLYDNLDLYGLSPRKKPKEKYRAHSIETLELLDRNDIDLDVPKRGHDLTDDIRVNEILKMSGARTNPDAEFIDVDMKKKTHRRKPFDHAARGRKKWYDDIEDFNEDFDRELRPIKNDLSNDIRVNDILAARGAPINPDAEFIDERVSKIRPRVHGRKKTRRFYY